MLDEDMPSRLNEQLLAGGHAAIEDCAGNEPLFARVINAVPWLQGITARFIGLGARPEHVHSPEAYPVLRTQRSA